MYYFQAPRIYITEPERLAAAIESMGFSGTSDDKLQLTLLVSDKAYVISVHPDRYYGNVSVCSDSTTRDRGEDPRESDDDIVKELTKGLSRIAIDPLSGKIDDELSFIAERFSDRNIHTLVQQVHDEHAAVARFLKTQLFEIASVHKKKREQLRQQLAQLCISRG